MKHRTRAVPMVLLAVFALSLIAGCAGTTGGREMSDDPVLIEKELLEISNDMENTEEMIKGSRAQLQYEDSQDLRDNIRQLEMRLLSLESQKRALEERLTELEASGTS